MKDPKSRTNATSKKCQREKEKLSDKEAISLTTAHGKLKIPSSDPNWRMKNTASSTNPSPKKHDASSNGIEPFSRERIPSDMMSIFVKFQNSSGGCEIRSIQ